MRKTFLELSGSENKLAQTVVDCGALDALVICLEEFDPGVKEAAAWALGYIARHNDDLAQVPFKDLRTKKIFPIFSRKSLELTLTRKNFLRNFQPNSVWSGPARRNYRTESTRSGATRPRFSNTVP